MSYDNYDSFKNSDEGRREGDGSSANRSGSGRPRFVKHTRPAYSGREEGRRPYGDNARPYGERRPYGGNSGEARPFNAENRFNNIRNFTIVTIISVRQTLPDGRIFLQCFTNRLQKSTGVRLFAIVCRLRQNNHIAIITDGFKVPVWYRIGNTAIQQDMIFDTDRLCGQR